MVKPLEQVGRAWGVSLAWVLIAGLLCLGSGAPEKGISKSEGLSQSLPLEAGWNLVVFPTVGAEWFGEQTERLALWSAKASEPRSQLDQAPVPGEPYWVWSRDTLAWAIESNGPTEVYPQVPQDEALELGRFKLLEWNGATYADERVSANEAPESRRVELLRWNGATQAYERVPGDEALEAGRGYWARITELGREPWRSQGDEGSTESVQLVKSAPLDTRVAPSSEVSLHSAVDALGEAGVATSSEAGVTQAVVFFEARPKSPGRFSGGLTGRVVHLAWHPPRLLEGGAPIGPGLGLSYRLYRDGVLIQDLGTDLTYQEVLPASGEVYRYTVTACVHPPGSDPLESVPTEPIEVRAQETEPVPEPGSFETPGLVVHGERPLALPKAALSRVADSLYAHVVYVARGEVSAPGNEASSGDQILFVRSERAGKGGTFSDKQVLAQTTPPWRVTDLVLAVDGERVSVAWIETASGGQASAALSRLSVIESEDSGRRFGTPSRLGLDESWKRGMDFSYDHRGDRHLVWGEANKIYYLKNLSGEPENVFDVRKRKRVTEHVKYKAYYPPDPECRCPSCWCEENYRFGQSADQRDGGPSSGAYVERQEEAYVYQPALHLDKKSITIVSVQTKAWDNDPVIEPAWQAMLKHPVYADEVVHLRQPTRFVVGWHKTWKQAYEPNDEALWGQLGFQYQYRYAGRWDTHQRIKLARRPLFVGAWSSSESVGAEGVWKQGQWQGDVQANWRISDVTNADAADDERVFSHPDVHTGREGQMVVVFERAGVVHASTSVDGGLVWRAPVSVGPGRNPKLARAESEDLTLVSAAAEQEADGKLRVFRAAADGIFATMNAFDSGQVFGVETGGPSLNGWGELLLLAWVRKAQGPHEHDPIVVSRASKNVQVAHLDAQVVGPVYSGGRRQVSFALENQFHMRVDQEVSVRVSTENPSEAESSFVSAPGPLTLSLNEGAATAWVAPSASNQSVFYGVDLLQGADGDIGFEFLSSEGSGYTEMSSGFESTGTESNYLRAQRVRDALFRSPADSGEGNSYQVEYADDEDAADQDASYLAQYERVWAYTQGIALAQFSRQENEADAHKSMGLARYLCARAERADDGFLIQGWPFSWNTKGDAWKDRRLVTGATAWVVHGLGAFITSSNFKLFDDERQKTAVRRCYLGALEGLKTHRQRLHLERGRPVSLMTAGWTASGLAASQKPWTLGLALEGSSAEDPKERWAYYSVLDAVGYESFSPTAIRVCKQGDRCYEKGAASALWQELSIDEKTWSELRRRVRAQNVVTEHNVDVLSVLNHALRFSEELGIADRVELEQWRDELRDGVFYGLWDSEGWKNEFEDALEGMDETREAAMERTASQKERYEKRRQAMEALLQGGVLGRVVTGGFLQADESGELDLKTSHHSAIDNCSWLSLSVDYEKLGPSDVPGGNPYVERLALCLQYTVLQYAKDLSFDGNGCDSSVASCPPLKTYRGTHYFQNAFRDPYIEPSELQASSYHLEATMGLILGLFRFVEAYPEHPNAEAFRHEAQHLWAGAQGFVRDHGFPYSSQRIQDLSTRLFSSTAAIWFIDVHDYLTGVYQNAMDRPLKSYATGLDKEPTLARLFDDYETLKAQPASLPQSHDFPGASRVLSGPKWGQSGRPYTLLGDQALAVLVATAKGDRARAEKWASALLTMRVFDASLQEETSGIYSLEFAHAVYADDGLPIHDLRDVGTEMLAHYALSFFLRRFPDTALKGEVEETLVEGLDTLTTLYQSDGAGGTFGLYRRPSLGQGRLVVASVDENVNAFFALDGAALVLGDTASGARMAERAQRLKERLLESCGVLFGRRPLREIYDEGRAAPGVRRKDGFRCSLFASYTGHYEAASDLLDAPWYEDAVGGPKTIDTSPPDSSPMASREGAFGGVFRWGQSVELLARRALLPVDPRQRELALVGLLRAHPEQVSDRLAAMLVQEPGGAFGVGSGPLVAHKSDALLAEKMASSDAGLVRKRLADHFVDRLFALAVSEPTQGRFSAIFMDLVLIRFAEAQVLNQGPSLTDEEWILRVEHDLRNDLCNPSFIAHQGEVPLEAYFGVDCERLKTLLRELFRAFGSLGGDHWVLVAGSPEGGQRYTEILQDVTRGSDSRASSPLWVMNRGPGDGARSLVLDYTQAGLKNPDGASVAAIQAQLRKRIEAIAEAGLRNALSAGHSLDYELYGLDLARVFHSDAAEYWRQSSIVLRVALSDAFQDSVRFTVRGHAMEPPAFPLGVKEGNNVRFLRREINTRWNGMLVSMADAADLRGHSLTTWMAYVHRALRTGVFSETGFEAWIQGLRLDEATQKVWRETLQVFPDKRTEVSMPTSSEQDPPAQPSLQWSQGFEIPRINLALLEWAQQMGPFSQDGVSVAVEGMGLLRIPRVPAKPGQGSGSTPVQGGRLRVEKGLLKAMEALFRQDPATVGIGSALAATLGLFLSEPTAGAETLFVLDAIPPQWEDFWVPVGWVEASSVFDVDGEGVGFVRETPWADWYALRSESDIRTHVRILTEPALGAPWRPFDDDRIYLFEKEIYEAQDIPGFENPGFLDLALPGFVSHIEDGELLRTYALDTSYSAEEIVERVLEENPAWRWYLEVGKSNPALLEPMWLNVMRSYLVGAYFNPDAAVRVGTRKEGADLTGTGAGGHLPPVPDAQGPPSEVEQTNPGDPVSTAAVAKVLKVLDVGEEPLELLRALATYGSTSVDQVRFELPMRPNGTALKTPVIALRNAGLVTIRPADKPVTILSRVDINRAGLAPVTRYLAQFFPGSEFKIDNLWAEIDALAQPASLRILDAVASGPLPRSELESRLSDLAGSWPRTISDLEDVGLIEVTDADHIQIPPQASSTLLFVLRGLVQQGTASTQEVLKRAAEFGAFDSKRVLNIIGALASYGDLTVHDLRDLFGDQSRWFISDVDRLRKVGLVSVTPADRKTQIMSTVRLEPAQFGPLRAFLAQLFPGTEADIAEYEAEVSALSSRESVLVLDRVAAGAKTFEALKAQLSRVPRLGSVVEDLVDAGMLIQSEKTSELSLNRERGSSFGAYLDIILAKEHRLQGEVFFRYRQLSALTWTGAMALLDYIVKKGPTRFRMLQKHSNLDTVGMETMLKRLADADLLRLDPPGQSARLLARTKISLHEDGIAGLALYLRHLLPGDTVSEDGFKDELLELSALKKLLILARLSTGPRFVQMLGIDFPDAKGNLRFITEDLEEAGLIEIAEHTEKRARIAPGRGSSVAARLESLLSGN